MDFNGLELFYYVVKYKSFSKASEKLFIAQSSISKRIKNFEHELNTILIMRSSKTFRLTERGDKLFVLAQKMVEKTGNFERTVQSDNTLVIAMVGIYLSWTQTMILKRLGQEFWNIHFIYGSEEYCYNELKSGRVNAIVSGSDKVFEETDYLVLGNFPISLFENREFDSDKPYKLYVFKSYSLKDEMVESTLRELKFSPEEVIFSRWDYLNKRLEIDKGNYLILGLEALFEREIMSGELKIMKRISDIKMHLYFNENMDSRVISYLSRGDSNG